MRKFFILNRKNESRVCSVEEEIEKFKKWGNVEDINIFDAIMAKNFSKEEINSYAYQPSFLTPGEIGCALSHLAIYRQMVEENIPYALIMEDDAGIMDTKTINLDLECVELFAREKAGAPFILALQKSIYHDKLESSYENFNIYRARNLFRACGYVINLKAAKAILEIQTPVRFEIDAFKFYYWLDACTLYCTNKDIIDTKTDIAAESIIIECGEVKYTSLRHKMKNNNFKVLYNQLPIRKKILVQKKRAYKLLCKYKENLNY